MPEICEALSYEPAVTLALPWNSWELAEVFHSFSSGDEVSVVNEPRPHSNDPRATHTWRWLPALPQLGFVWQDLPGFLV